MLYAGDFSVFNQAGDPLPPWSFPALAAGHQTFGAANPARDYTAPPPKINEYRPHHHDDATQKVELLGEPGAIFTASLVMVSGDTANPGKVTSAETLSGSFDMNGLHLVTVPSMIYPPTH